MQPKGQSLAKPIRIFYKSPFYKGLSCDDDTTRSVALKVTMQAGTYLQMLHALFESALPDSGTRDTPTGSMQWKPTWYDPV
jgi:hypothetical protein